MNEVTIEINDDISIGVLNFFRHPRDKCMECNRLPVYEVLWAEGMAHAWFCAPHFLQWALCHYKECREGGWAIDIDSVKEIVDGVASKKFRDNPNENVFSKLIQDIKQNKRIAHFKELLTLTPHGIRNLPKSELITKHWRCHQLSAQASKQSPAWKEQLYNIHRFIVEEMKRRGIEHRPISWLDKPLISKEDEIVINILV